MHNRMMKSAYGQIDLARGLDEGYASHPGRVFDEGPKVKGLRYRIDGGVGLRGDEAGWPAISVPDLTALNRRYASTSSPTWAATLAARASRL